MIGAIVMRPTIAVSSLQICASYYKASRLDYGDDNDLSTARLSAGQANYGREMGETWRRNGKDLEKTINLCQTKGS